MGLQTEGAKLTPGQKALYGAGAPEAFGSSEMNLFRYCGDDPVDRSDPSGLEYHDDGSWRPVDQVDKNSVGRTFVTVQVNVVPNTDGAFRLQLDVTVTDRVIANQIFWHGKWTTRTEAQKAATIEHETVYHAEDWKGFDKKHSAEIPKTEFSTKTDAEKAAKPLNERLNSEAWKSNKEFNQHQPKSRWDPVQRRETP